MTTKDTSQTTSVTQSDSEEALHLCRTSCFVSNHTQLDVDRTRRTGCPEIIFCEGKTPEQTTTIFQKMVEVYGECLGTRATEAHYHAVKKDLPDAQFCAVAQTLFVQKADKERFGCVLVINAGTSDHGVAEEAALTAEFLGSNVIRHFDCGVAGVHRALTAAKDFSKASAIVAVAGMDGALPTIVAGLSPAPVIAVPTSIGYGTGLGGVAALMTMLNGCAPGVSVVNIDNGFGAGYQAHIINTMASKTL
ncbi:nickel pincer cofactor biosynthesis protein LarB [Halodesulfovibrio sp.]|jgi:NCAIR mutase (PurE)-related protein|uniref:nickel pincer cofactor biosynthesis protein LarB n=1 Tax=Halodesulfovibrio sp. TaxID=1912772 RepID=UPI0025CF95D2|nr:nickel pincer cofactor biosynthesis protein LarB [Halodesulfovibrio sp.]MCT4535557.1 nickel pincer cofactor biosynthesis protein LarB [Halodesulfovibrio sp.]MCT4626542.1 nickel pincer cofactor biosynthesis protein LarB [Halodesulfovibrio sp.]